MQLCGHVRSSHQEEAYHKKELTPDTQRFRRRAKGKVVGAIKPTLESWKVLCLDTEGDH
jgi:hypothetical protein